MIKLFAHNLAKYIYNINKNCTVVPSNNYIIDYFRNIKIAYDLHQQVESNR